MIIIYMTVLYNKVLKKFALRDEEINLIKFKWNSNKDSCTS